MLGYDKNEVFKKRDKHTCGFSKLSEELNQLTEHYVKEVENGEKLFGLTTKTIERGY